MPGIIMITKEKLANPHFQAILNAAAKIFRTKGYHHANMSEIAREVGLQKASLYHHIESKEELLYAILLTACETYYQSFKKVLLSTQSPDILLKEAIIAHMTPILSEFDRSYLLLHELHNVTGEYRKEIDFEIKKYVSTWVDILERGKRSGLFRADLNVKITMLSIFGICNWTLQWYRPEGKYNARELSELYASNFLDGIRAIARETSSPADNPA